MGKCTMSDYEASINFLNKEGFEITVHDIGERDCLFFFEDGKYLFECIATELVNGQTEYVIANSEICFLDNGLVFLGYADLMSKLSSGSMYDCNREPIISTEDKRLIVLIAKAMIGEVIKKCKMLKCEGAV